MPTELPGFRRPRPPRIDDFTDELERQLVQIIVDRPPRQVPRWRLNLERWSRYLVRPLVNGAMIAAVAVAIAISLPASSDPLVNDRGQPSKRNSSRHPMGRGRVDPRSDSRLRPLPGLPRG